MKPPARLAPVFCGVVAMLFALAACSGKRTPTAPVNPGTPAGNDLTRALLSHMPAAFIVPTTIDSSASLLIDDDCRLNSKDARLRRDNRCAERALARLKLIVSLVDLRLSGVADGSVVLGSVGV